MLRSFEEFEKEYLTQISKFFEAHKPRIDHKDKFSSITELAKLSFDELSEDAIKQVLDFASDDSLEKLIEENEKTIQKNKLAIAKKKTKYFEKFRSIVKDILLDCKASTTPMKENSIIANTSPNANTHIDERKKKKLTFNEDINNVVVYDT